MIYLMVLILLLEASVQASGKQTLLSSGDEEFKIPEATLEFLSPKGLRISVPDWDEDVTVVAFHVNVNLPFRGVEAGQWAADVHKKRDSRWSLSIPDLRVRRGDTVDYWVFAIRHGRGYQNLHRSYRLQSEDPHLSGERSSMISDMSTPPPMRETEVSSKYVATRGTSPAPSAVGDIVDWRG